MHDASSSTPTTTMYQGPTETSATALLPEEIAAYPEVSGRVHASVIFRAAHGRLSPHLQHEFRYVLSRHRAFLERRTTTVANTFSDRDGNVKLKMRLADGAAVETVVLVDRKPGVHGAEDVRKTLCVSSQVGCAIGCTFCKTGRLGFHRNLTTEEIVEQLVAARERFGAITNIVFMGMGEPLLNTDNVLAAVRIFAHPHGPAVAPKRITVSTCGIPSAIDRLASEPALESRPTAPPRLAVSLVSAQPELRAELMPGATQAAAGRAISGSVGAHATAGTAGQAAGRSVASRGFEALEAALGRYLEYTGRHLTLEFPLFSGVNDTRAESTALCRFLARLPRRDRVDVNVIPWNHIEGLPFSSPSAHTVYEFTGRLVEAGYTVTGRHPRGRGIGAACGQLGETTIR